MNKIHLMLVMVFTFVSLLWGQLSISQPGVVYSQNFDTLTSGSWSNNETLVGWYARTDAISSITTYAAGVGASTGGQLYAFGVLGEHTKEDRALGLVATDDFFGTAGSGKGYLGWRLKNETGKYISSISITWSGEQWRRGANTNTQSISLSYQTGISIISLITGTWTTTSSIFISPQTGTIAASLDGNLPENRVSNITCVLSDLHLQNGDEIMLRWSDLNDIGNDHTLAIDDVSITSAVEETLPVELSSFTAGIDAYGKIQLQWVTQSETNAYGFYVLRASENQIGNAEIISPLIGATNTSTQQLYQFTDESIWQQGVYYYWLQSCDLDGSSFFHGPCACFFDPDSEHQTPDIPFHEGISGVYPNPFNPSTTINYGISKPGAVELMIYNLKGQKVRSYQAYHSQPGEYTQVWDGLDSEGNICSSGIYNIVMSEGGRRYYRKVVLSK